MGATTRRSVSAFARRLACYGLQVMVRLCVALGALLLGAVALAAQPTLSVTDAWTRVSPPGSSVGAGYLHVENRGPDDRLVAVESPRAKRVELHGASHEGGVMRMWRLEDGLALPRGARVRLQPGGTHLMFFELSPPLALGEKMPLTLRFEKAGSIEIALDVLPIGAVGPRASGASAQGQASGRKP
jgi:copper(I)-binding protein